MNACCVDRELPFRLQRARADLLSRALHHILRMQSIDKIREVAQGATQAEWAHGNTLDGLPIRPSALSEPTPAERLARKGIQP